MAMKLRRREILEGYLFVAPWLIGFGVFMAFPIGYSLWLSLCRWELITPEVRFVGLDNFRRMLTQDPRFWVSLRVTALYALGSVPLTMAGGYLLALLLNQPVWGVRVFRTLFYLPAVLSGVAVAILWVALFNPESGLINQVLGRALAPLGVAPSQLPGWLSSRAWALPALILMSLWGVGGSMVIYLAALQGIPRELYESAMIDGAGAWGRLRHVTLPMTTPVIFFTLIMSIIGSFQVFTQGYVMTGGGPQDATLFYVLYLWQRAFQDFQVGYACALAWVLFVAILALTLLCFRTARHWVHYEALGQ